MAQAGEDADKEGGVGERAGEAHGGRGLREPLAVHGDGEQCLLVVGSGYTVMPDNDLVSDASGNGIPLSLTTSSQYIGARAIEGGVAGDPIRVTVTLRDATRT